jgi:hypothetical protein
LWIQLLGREFINTRQLHFPYVDLHRVGRVTNDTEIRSRWENMCATLVSLIVPAGK